MCAEKYSEEFERVKEELTSTKKQLAMIIEELRTTHALAKEWEAYGKSQAAKLKELRATCAATPSPA